MGKVSFFNQPIKCDYGSLYQLLLTCKAYHFKLNLANAPVQRDWASLKAPQCETVQASSCILMLLLLQHLLTSIFSSFCSISWVWIVLKGSMYNLHYENGSRQQRLLDLNMHALAVWPLLLHWESAEISLAVTGCLWFSVSNQNAWWLGGYGIWKCREWRHNLAGENRKTQIKLKGIKCSYWFTISGMV